MSRYKRFSLVLTAAPLLLPLTLACADKDQGRAPGTAGARAEAKKESFGRLSVEEVESRMKEAAAGKLKLFIYDNNGYERYQQSHLPGARWVQYDEIKATDLPADKQATLVFYCANEH